MEERASMISRKITNVAILVIVYFVLLVLPWLVVVHAQTPTPTPDFSHVDFSKITEDDIKKTEEHRDALRQGARQAAEEQNTVINDQSSTLTDVRNANAKMQKTFDDYRSVAEAQIAKGNVAMLKYAEKAAKLRFVGYVGNVFILIIAAFIALRVPAFGVYIGGGIAVAVSIAWWSWILM